MRVLFLTKYTERGASSRYRVHQYLPYLNRIGVKYSVRPFFPDAYLDLIYRKQSHRTRRLQQAEYGARALWRRWRTLRNDAKSYDVVYCEYEALPYIPFALEQGIFATGNRVVVDYDDAIHENYANNRNSLLRHLLRTKLSQLVSASDCVIVANHNLEVWARGFNDKVVIIPTTIDLDQYTLRPNFSEESAFSIGWIGTPVTAPYLNLVSAPLRQLASESPFTLRVIGAPDFAMDGVTVVNVPWQQSTEVQELRHCMIGIMPLSDNSWTRGKSSLKLLQYLAAGLVGVASPVGSNCDIINDGENGFLATTEEEWLTKLRKLFENAALRHSMAQAGRRTVEQKYSVTAHAPRWLAAVLGNFLDNSS